MFAVDPSFPLDVQRANYDYFEPRCSHGSSLSHSVHATVATRLGPFDDRCVEHAYDYFMQTAVFGFGGFSIDDGTVQIVPALPRSWTSLDYAVIMHGQRLTVGITPTAVTVAASPDNTAAVPVRLGAESAMELLGPGNRMEG